MDELVDLSDADMSQVTPEGLAGLADEIIQVFEEYNVTTYKTAVFSPHDLPFGFARLYEAYTFESPETVQVFRERDEALNWLLD